jgi:hypothetical protein
MFVRPSRSAAFFASSEQCRPAIRSWSHCSRIFLPTTFPAEPESEAILHLDDLWGVELI